MPKITTTETQKKTFSSGYATNALQGAKVGTTPAKGKATEKKDNMLKAPEPPKEKLPDFSPRAQNWEELPSRISSANMYALLSGDTKRSLDDLAKDMGTPVLAFTGTLLQEIRYITKSLPNSEHAVFLALRRIDENRPHFLAYDFFMPEQTASGGGVSLDPKDCQRHFDKLKEHPWYSKNGMHRHLCHLHSHAGMGVFWSSVDDTQQLSRDDLGFMDDFRFYCVVNTKDEIKCSLVIYKPALTRLDAVVAVSYAGDGHAEELTRKRKAELDHIIKTALSHAQTNRWNIGESEFEDEETPTLAAIAKKQDYPGFCNRYPRNAGSSFTDWGYGDAIHRYANGRWDDGGDEPSVREVDIKNRKLRLDLIPVPQDAKHVKTVPVSLVQSFMENSNSDEKMAKQVIGFLSTLLAETGVCLECVDKRTGEVLNEGVSPEIVGELFADYLCEFSDIVSNPSFYETEMPDYVTAETIKAVCEKNKQAVFKSIVDDLTELVAEGVWE